METIDKHHSDHNPGHRPRGRLAFGLILLMAGFFLLLRNANIFPLFIERIIFSWQMLLIVIGLLITMGASNKTPGIIVMAIGAFFMLPQLFPFIFIRYNLFWPAVLIIGGLALIISGKRLSERLKFQGTDNSTDQYIDIVNIFGGGDRQVITDNFSGGRVTSIFGGSKIDLTRSGLAPGVSQLDITCIFGGTEIIVPGDWNIVLDVTPVLGGFSDERKSVSIGDPGRQLVIRGTVVFGGGDLKSYPS